MRNRLNYLAKIGGDLSLDEPLHVGRPNICDRERLMKRIDTLLERRWLTNKGPYVTEFEEKMDDDFNTREALAVVFSLTREANRLITENNLSQEGVDNILNALETFD